MSKIKSLTNLTQQDVRGKSKTAIMRTILQQIGFKIEPKPVISELKRLTGDTCHTSLFYSERKKVREESRKTVVPPPSSPVLPPSNAGPGHQQSTQFSQEVYSVLESLIKVRQLAHDVGGVEKLRGYLDLDKYDQS